MVGNSNLAASIASAKGNLSASSSAFTLAHSSLSKSANDFFSVADLIEARFKELEQKEIEIELKDDQLTKKTSELEQREKVCLAREQQLDQREKQVDEKFAKWTLTEQQMAVQASKIPDVVSLNVGGKIFSLPKGDLIAHKGSYFESMMLTQHSQHIGSRELFIDRDRDIFGCVFHYLKTGKLRKANLGVEEVHQEFEFFKILFPYHQLPSSVYPKSELVSNLHEQIILEWLPNRRFYLLYKASKDGFAASEFRRLCNNKGPTLAVIKSDSNIFGGYASIPLDSSECYKSAPDSFIFTLTNPHGIPPTKYQLIDPTDEYAVSCYGGNGPSFGGDIQICAMLNTDGNRTKHGVRYANTTGKQFTFTGTGQFTAHELEVYGVSNMQKN